MKLEKTIIDGLFIIDGLNFKDLRGELVKPFSSIWFPDSVNKDIKEVWFTKSKKNVIRGMHLQVAPYPCEKIVSVIDGCVHDVILDLRKNSKTYGKTFDIEMSSDDIKAIYIPTGCAHGYIVLSDKAIVMYMGTEKNVSECEVGLKWNSFGYDWGIENPILSQKDENLEPFILGKIFF